MKKDFKYNACRVLMTACLLSILLMTSRCKKLVDIDQPNNTLTTTQVFTNNAQAASTLSGVYSQMMTNNGALTFSNGGTDQFAGLTADELVSYSGVLSPLINQFETNTLQYDNPTINNIFWKPAYHTINSVNSILEGAAASNSPQLTDSARRELIGEAKFVRAFHYLYLTNLFGDVPLVLTTDFNKTALLARAPQAAVYAQIVQDLLDAQATLPADYSVVASKERIRPNKMAATALLARVYLYQQNWKGAEDQATLVISNSQYSLPAPAGTFLKNSSEAIWQLQQNTSIAPYGTLDAKNMTGLIVWANQTPANQAASFLPAAAGTFAFAYIPTYYMSGQLSNAFEANDLRKKSWTSYVNTPPAYAPYNGTTIYYPFKYGVNGAANSIPTCYFMVLRLAEQYLIRTEARAQQTNLNGAATDLNAIRTRAGLPNTTATTQPALLAAVAQERRVELFAEWGHRLFDLKRTGQAGAVLGSIATKQPFNSTQLVYPIPPAEISNDPNLSQNPGY